MFLALDIGNTAVKGGLFDGASLEHSFTLEEHPAASAHRWREALEGALEGVPVMRAGLASVLPAATAAARSALRQLTDGAVEVLRTDGALPFRLAYETPATLGTDRLAAAAAAWMTYRPDPARPMVVVDAGTAVTYDVIDIASGAGVYRGGAIGAGPELVRRALERETAQLPYADAAPTNRCIGRSTSEALQSGIFYGFVDAARGMLIRFRAELDEQPVIILTGGWSKRLACHLDAVDHVDPHLVLRGVHLLLAGADEGTSK